MCPRLFARLSLSKNNLLYVHSLIISQNSLINFIIFDFSTLAFQSSNYIEFYFIFLLLFHNSDFSVYQES